MKRGVRMKWLAVLILIFLLLFGCNFQTNEPNEGTIIDVDRELPAEYVDLNRLKAEVVASPGSEQVGIKVELRNENEVEADLTFLNDQIFELVIREDGDTVFRKFVDDPDKTVGNQITIDASESVEWTTVWDYKREDGTRVSPGSYDMYIYFLPYKISEMEVNDAALYSTTKIEIPAENNAFRNVSVEGAQGEYIVSGEARVFEAQFMYMVEDGHNIFIDETPVMVAEGGPAWSPFKINISIDQEDLPKNGTLTLILFERSAKDDSIINQYYVALEHFD